MTHLAVAEVTKTAPAHWRRARFKAIATRIENHQGGRKLELLSLASAGYLSARVDGGNRQQPAPESVPRYLVVEPGDLVVNPMWLTGGSIAVTQISGAVSPDYRVFRMHHDAYPRFVHHLMRSQPYLDQYQLYTRADTTFDRRVQQGDLDNLPVALPPIDEQRRIAAFLDDQVARIDQAISLREKQALAMLQRRDSSIASTVTEAPFEWLPLRRVVANWIDYRGATPTKTSAGVPLVTARNISGGVVDMLRSQEFIAEADFETWMRRGLPQVGDVLITTEAPLGQLAMVTDPAVALAQRIILMRPDSSRISSEWLYWTLRSPQVQAALAANSTGTTAAGIKGDRLYGIEVPVPSLVAQEKGISKLQDEEHLLRHLQHTLEHQTALLQERKRSMITAAVTGEFDVGSASTRAPAGVAS